jgi:hypothetical protein
MGRKIPLSPRESTPTFREVLSCEFWVLSYLSRAGAKETRGTKETRQTKKPNEPARRVGWGNV